MNLRCSGRPSRKRRHVAARRAAMSMAPQVSQVTVRAAAAVVVVLVMPFAGCVTLLGVHEPIELAPPDEAGLADGPSSPCDDYFEALYANNCSGAPPPPAEQSRIKSRYEQL